MGFAAGAAILEPAQAEPSKSPIDRQHSDYILVRGKKWGDELSTLEALVAAMGHYVPVVCLLVGGDITTDRAVRCVCTHAVARRVHVHDADIPLSTSSLQVKLLARQRIPIIVLKGSGGTADQVSLAHSRKSAAVLVPKSLRGLVQSPQSIISVFDTLGSGGSPELRNMLLRAFYVQRSQVAVSLKFSRARGPPAPAFPPPCPIPMPATPDEVGAAVAPGVSAAAAAAPSAASGAVSASATTAGGVVGGAGVASRVAEWSQTDIRRLAHRRGRMGAELTSSRSFLLRRRLKTSGNPAKAVARKRRRRKRRF